VGLGYQAENWLLDPDKYWNKTGRATWQDLQAIESDAEDLWLGSAQDTISGLNDRVTTGDVADIDDSLRLIRVDELEVAVFAPGANFGDPKRKVQGRFTYCNISYRVWITDPLIEREFRAKADGAYALGESFLTISLGEPHEGYCYKMIAAVISRNRI